MSWLTVAILSYFLFSIVSLTDKFLLSGPPKPKIYAFYAGTLGGLIAILIPFIENFSIPRFRILLFTLITGAIFTIALLAIYEGLEHYEASRIVSSIGGLTPLFAFCLTFLISGTGEMLPLLGFLAFVLLALGSFLITKNSAKKNSWGSFLIAALASLCLALYFIFAKYVYHLLPFWNGLILIKIGSLIAALFFIFSREVREELFHKKKKSSFNKKTGAIFILNQGFGAAAAILQNWAIALAGIAYVSIVIALQGIQYLFVFVLAILFSWKFPKILKEETSKEIIVQKIIAILFIMTGLALIAFV